MSTLLTRAITAFVFVAIVLAGIYYSKYTFAILFLVVTILCLWEFYSHIFKKSGLQNSWRKWLGLVLGALPFSAAAVSQVHYGEIDNHTWLSLASLYLVLFFSAFIFELFSNKENPFRNIGYIFLGVVYVGLPFALLNFIAFHEGSYYPNLIFGILWLTWANDTGAYLFGSRIGKTPLFPRISPKKTWEGSISGVVCTFLMGWGMSYVFSELNLASWLVVATLVAVFASVGDLIESMFKRSLGIKDSGNVLPGHGGFLDRFDAMIFLIPFVLAYLMLIR